MIPPNQPLNVWVVREAVVTPGGTDVAVAGWAN
jgi:hypothetical protein